MGQSTRPLDNLTKLEKHKLLKRQSAEDAEKLAVLGQESDKKAKKWVQEIGRENEKVEKARISDVLTKLDDVKGHVLTYKGQLLEEMRKEMNHWLDEVPEGFHWAPQATDKGLVLWIKTPQGEYHAQGISLSTIPEVDLNAIARIIVKAIQEMVKQEDAAKQTANGLILPYK